MIEVMEQGGRIVACLVGGGALQLYDVTDPGQAGSSLELQDAERTSGAHRD